MKEKKSWEKISFFLLFELRKKYKNLDENLNVDELLESCLCHLSSLRLKKVENFPQLSSQFYEKDFITYI